MAEVYICAVCKHIYGAGAHSVDEQKGYLRTCPVFVGGNKKMQWQNVREALNEWSASMNNGDQVLLDPKTLHIIYENIHPFTDGNGRTGRMFYNWQCVKKLHSPIKIFYEAERQEYYQWFR